MVEKGQTDKNGQKLPKNVTDGHFIIYSLPYLVVAILEEKIAASIVIHYPWGTLYKLLLW